MPVPRRIKRNGHYTYQHSSPPKVLNGSEHDKDEKEALVIKPSSIRIWIHEKDIKKLTKVLWEGQGMRLCRETSTHKKVKAFLDAVPYVMATIKDVHTAAINNDLDLLEAASADPVPPEMLACKDANGLTPLHKAAGLGHLECLEYILMKYPNAATIEDNTGKTALHWASAKNNFRAFNLLVQAGADEIANDHHMRHPAYYRNKPNEVDKTLLHVVPEAPRVPKKPPTFDWSMFFDEDAANNNEPRLVQSLLSSRIGNNAANSNNIRKAKSTDPIKEIDESAEPVKIASYSMEHIVDKTFEDLNESESNRSRKDSESQNETVISENTQLDEVPNGNHLEKLELDPEKNVDELVEENNKNIDNSNSQHGDKNDLVDEVESVIIENGNNNNDEKHVQPKQEDMDDETGNEVSNIEDNVNNVEEVSKVDVGENSTTEDAEYADDENESDTARNNTENEVQNEIETDDIPTPTHTLNESNAEVLVINSDEAEHEKDDDSTGSSPTPEMEISGIVKGEPETDTLESQGDPKFDDDEDIKKLIENGDMEKLAGLVLNGHGHKLDGFKSDHPEIQSFLDNVPAYMEKIKKVHVAARDGNLRDLQAALDRRKFATARDKASPYGGTPLHVATIFGHAGIVRYLAGRFSETLQAKDDHGRTPLHYAAVIKDNGHFHNLLLHLGADPNIKDNEGHTAEFYTKHDQSDKILSHKQLLRDYGADESLADDMLLDQDANNGQIEIPLFRTEEGVYLATSLGDPLIKGLTEVANVRPPDPISFLANYLLDFAKKHNKIKNTEEISSIALVRGDPDIEVQEASSGLVTPAKVVKQSSAHVIRRAAIEPAPNNMELDDASDGHQSTTPGDDRDEHGQSILHFACARSHGKNALIQLIEESETSITYRDELYRTARDVSLQANQPDNAKEIDRFVVQLAARGDTETLANMVWDGYDHILDATDTEGTSIVQIARARGHHEVVNLLESLNDFEQLRENLLSAIRVGDLAQVKAVGAQSDMTKLTKAKNYYGRCSLHIAVLLENEEIVDYLASNFKATLHVGDNLARTPLHYAMGINNVEAISRILIKNGAKRVVKDLKGRQPSYYFMNKADILRLQEEEKE